MEEYSATFYCANGNYDRELSDGDLFYFKPVNNVCCGDICVNAVVLKYVGEQRSTGRMSSKQAREAVSTAPALVSRENALELLVRGKISQSGLRRQQL